VGEEGFEVCEGYKRKEGRVLLGGTPGEVGMRLRKERKKHTVIASLVSARCP